MRDLGSTYGGLTGKSKSDFGTGSAKFVTFMEVMEGSRLRGERLESVRVVQGESQNQILCGDVLFNGSSETPGEVALSSVVVFDPSPGTYLNSFCFGFRVKRVDLVDPTFLAYYFRSAEGRSLVSPLAQGAIRYNIARTKFLDLELDLPDLSRQSEIVEVLTDADDSVRTLEVLIAKKEAIRQGIMQQLLTGKTRLSRFTEPWTPVCLGDRVRFLRTVALSRAQLDSTSSVRCLHYGDIHRSPHVRLAAEDEDMPRVPRALLGRAELLEVGDLVFADASEDPSGVGRSLEVTSVPEAGLIAGLHTIAARFDKSAFADGFKAYLQFNPDFRSALVRLAAGTKVLATTRSYLASIELVVPGIPEQSAIASTLGDTDREIESLRKALASARHIKQGMMQQLLRGRTRLLVEGSAE